jgi:hypothetical protein
MDIDVVTARFCRCIPAMLSVMSMDYAFENVSFEIWGAVMNRMFWIALIMGCCIGSGLADDFFMTRVLSCSNQDAKIEIFVPQSVLDGLGVKGANLSESVSGVYSYDLSSLEKGKSLTMIRVSYSPDKKMVIVEQEGMPPTRVPVGGGTVDFDKRFAVKVRCGPFNNG